MITDWLPAVAVPLGGVIGWALAARVYRKEFDLVHIRKRMNRIVNLEEIEERERMLKVRMMRNGRKTTRLDSGPNARITRMRVTKGAKRR